MTHQRGRRLSFVWLSLIQRQAKEANILVLADNAYTFVRVNVDHLDP